MHEPSIIGSESGVGSGTGYTYSGQYGVRRASTRPDAYGTKFGSITADEYLTPMIHLNQRTSGNIARRLSRNSFLIPPQTFVRRATEGMLISTILFPYYHIKSVLI
jgi:hypothetical protein